MRKSTLWFIAAIGSVSTMTASPSIVKASQSYEKNSTFLSELSVTSSEIDLKKGLVAWFPFSGNSSDESGNGHDALLNGARLTSDRYGKPNSAYLFNGKKNILPFAGIRINRPQATLSFWTRTNLKSGKILTLEAIRGKVIITVRKVNHKFELELKVNNKKTFLKDKMVLPDPDAFNFIALVSDGRKIRFMVNNRLVGSINLDKKMVASYFPVTLKKDPIFYSKAVLDDISLYSRALNRQELETLFNQSFTTPELSYETHIKIAKTSADIYRTVLSDGGSAITKMGVCWNTTGNPDTTDNRTSMPGHTGLFKSTITDLLPGTKYYAKAYAINSSGIGYSDEVFEFITLPDLDYGTVTDIDGNNYRTITIGTQTWMAENLRTSRYADGTPIMDGTSRPSTPGKYYYVFQGDTLHREIFGLLYTWEGATNSTPGDVYLNGTRGACPDGWHIPSYAEKQTLLNELGGPRIAGGKLKEAGEMHWDSPTDGTNQTGFTALGSGVKAMEEGVYGVFVDYRSLTYYWTSESYSNNLPVNPDFFSPVLDVTGTDPHYWSPPVNYGAPVRCIMDNTNSYVTIPEVVTDPVTDISSTTATGGGTIANDGGQFRTIRGICWSNSPSPDTSDFKTLLLDDRNSFTSAMTQLAPNTRYYVRAYGITSAGINYGNEESFVAGTNASVVESDRNVYQKQQDKKTSLAEPDFDFYPNPAQSVIQFKNITERTRVVIYDSKGKILKSGNVNGNKLDISWLADGIYYMIITNDTNTVTKKLIKQ